MKRKIFSIKQNLYLFLILLISGLFSTCSTVIIKKDYIYKYKNRFAIKSADLNRSSEKIDRAFTYQLFFILPKNEKSIKISLACKKNGPNLKFPYLKTYFIAEKALSSAHYKDSPLYIYSELGQNYNNNWETEQNIIIESDISDPIKKLTPGLYRLRFTIFDKLKFPCQYTLNIHADSQIKIFNNFPENPENPEN